MSLLFHCSYSTLLFDYSITPLFYSSFIVFVYNSMVFESSISFYSSVPWFRYFGLSFYPITRLLYSVLLLDHSILVFDCSTTSGSPGQLRPLRGLQSHLRLDVHACIFTWGGCAFTFQINARLMNSQKRCHKQSLHVLDDWSRPGSYCLYEKSYNQMRPPQQCSRAGKAVLVLSFPVRVCEFLFSNKFELI